MFWSFTPWPTAPAPYDQRASSWVAPVEMQGMPMLLLRTSMYPKRMDQVRQGIQQVGEPAPRIFLPSKMLTARSGPAFSAATAMSTSAAYVRNMSRAALPSTVVAAYEARQRQLDYHIPRVSTGSRPPPQNAPSGIYTVPPNPGAKPPITQALAIRKLLPQGIGPEQSMIGRVIGQVTSQRVMPGEARRLVLQER